MAAELGADAAAVADAGGNGTVAWAERNAAEGNPQQGGNDSASRDRDRPVEHLFLPRPHVTTKTVIRR